MPEKQEPHQAELERSERRFRLLCDSAPVGIFETNAEGDCLYVNARWSQMTGLGLAEAAGKGWLQTIHPDDRALVASEWSRAAAGSRELHLEYRYLCKGVTRWIVGTAVAIRGQSGELLGYQGTSLDISERKLAEESLRRSEADFRTLVDGSPEAMLLQRAGRIIYLNQRCAEVLGWESPASLLGTSLLELIAPPDRAMVQERIRLHLSAPGGQVRITIRFLRKDRSVVWFDATGMDVEFEGAPARLVVARDVSEQVLTEEARKVAEASLQRSLAEKETLLQEVHHRVKNNLQVVSSLLSLQAQQLHDPALRSIFDDSRARVHSIALLHEKLYTSARLDSIDVGDYLRALVASLARAQSHCSGRARIEVEVGDVRLPPDAAVPFGLIVNELVTNSLKHAFPDGRTGTVRVLVHSRDGRISVEVRDDGVGSPPEIGIDTARSVGLRLVRSLSQQIEGSVQLRSHHGPDQGTRVTLDFPQPLMASET